MKYKHISVTHFSFYFKSLKQINSIRLKYVSNLQKFATENRKPTVAMTMSTSICNQEF